VKLTKLAVSLIAANVMALPAAYATNGMLMEGYGPISTGMGGASMAFDNGTAGMANNPATLGLMPSGTNRFDLSIGGLHPDVKTTVHMASDVEAKSDGNAYYMPAVGWVRKDGALAYGVGVYAQGGMGTEYGTNTPLSLGTGLPVRSEVSLGNVIVPLAYDVTPDLTIGGSVSLVWGGMDLQMALTAPQMGAMAAQGDLIATGMGAMALPSFMQGGMANAGYISFSNNSDFTGDATSLGYSGKLGLTYKISKEFTLGAVYQSKTHLGDMTSSNAQMSMIDRAGSMGGPAGATYTLNGDVRIKDFQFPQVFGIGLAYQATPELLLVADYKRIGWKNVMEDFKLTFSSNDFGGLNMDMSMPQNWKDQNVFNLGLAYRVMPALTLRGGANLANNPVPDDTVNPLFPAIIKNHFTAGLGYDIDKANALNFSLVYAPNVSVTTQATPVSPSYTIDHSQLNWQLMYSYKF